VANARILCPHCGQETDVIAIHCSSGTVLDEPLERFTVCVIGDIDLHSEPDHAFFDIVHAMDGTVTLVPLPRPIRLSGNEHFAID
jgi:hypothetical protein